MLTNLEDTWLYLKVGRKVKVSRQITDMPAWVMSYNMYKHGVDLFDNRMETYFSSIWGKKWYYTFFLNT